MVRARNLKPGFFKNEELAECTPWARLCFVGLWTLADREGRLEDRPKRIKGELFAFDSIEVEPLLCELEKHSFILRYQSTDGRGLIQVLKFSEHQNPHHREPASDLPPPLGAPRGPMHEIVMEQQRQRILQRDGFKCVHCGAVTDLQVDHRIARVAGGSSDDENLQTLCKQCNLSKGTKAVPNRPSNSDPSDESRGFGVDDVSLHDAKAEALTTRVDIARGSSRAESGALIPDSGVVDAKSRGSRLPTDWAPGETGMAYALKQGLANGRVLIEAEKFRDYWAAEGGQKARKVDWHAAWRTWVRNAIEFSGKKGVSGVDDPFAGAH